MIRIVLLGAGGRMGRAVAETAAGDPVFLLKAGVDPGSRPSGWELPWSGDLEAVLERGDVVVDFSSPEGAARAARSCQRRGVALVSGTTGLTPDQELSLGEAARSVAVLRSSNFSLGLLALRRALGTALSALPRWDVEIVERHHRAKQDSPSGTALRLAEDVIAARGWSGSALRHGREGRVGPRGDQEIGVHAVRGGSWVGDHAVLLAGPGEWLELRHVAQDRTAFARGALLAAEFVSKAPAGLYTFEAVLSAT